MRAHQVLIAALASGLVSHVLTQPVSTNGHDLGSHSEQVCDNEGHCQDVRAHSETFVRAAEKLIRGFGIDTPNHSVCLTPDCRAQAVRPDKGAQIVGPNDGEADHLDKQQGLELLHLNLEARAGGSGGRVGDDAAHDGTSSGTGSGDHGTGSGGSGDAHSGNTGGSSDTEGGLGSTAATTDSNTGLLATNQGSQSGKRPLTPKEEQLLLQWEGQASKSGEKGSLEYLRQGKQKIDDKRQAYMGSKGKLLNDRDAEKSRQTYDKDYTSKKADDAASAQDPLKALGDKFNPDSQFRGEAAWSSGQKTDVGLRTIETYVDYDEGKRAIAVWRFATNDKKRTLPSSELSFVQLKKLAGDDAKSIEHYYAATVVNPVSTWIMMRNNKALGVGFDQVVTLSRHDTGDKQDMFNLMLGLDNVKPIGFMLAEHQQFFGRKTIDSVTYRISDSNGWDSPQIRMNLAPE